MFLVDGFNCQLPTSNSQLKTNITENTKNKIKLYILNE